MSKTTEVEKLKAEVQRLKVENKFLSKECERHQHDKSELRKELELQKNQAFRVLHEATAEVEQRCEEAEAARRAAEDEVQQLRGRVAKLRRRVQCMFGQVGCGARGVWHPHRQYGVYACLHGHRRPSVTQSSHTTIPVYTCGVPVCSAVSSRR